jgi:hypothetical protein
MLVFHCNNAPGFILHMEGLSSNTKYVSSSYNLSVCALKNKEAKKINKKQEYIYLVMVFFEASAFLSFIYFEKMITNAKWSLGSTVIRLTFYNFNSISTVASLIWILGYFLPSQPLKRCRRCGHPPRAGGFVTFLTR